MGVKINGEKYLNANNYKRIMIREEEEGYKIDITPLDKEFKTIPNYYKLTDDLKKMSSEEQIIEIVDNFLRNSYISKLEQKSFLDHYSGRFDVVKGTKELDLRLFNSNLIEVNQKIINKYRQDRYDFCELNQDVNNYYITTNKDISSYEKVDTNRETCIKFTFVHKGAKLRKIEEEFLYNFITGKLYNIYEEAKTVKEKIHSNYPECDINLMPCLVCGDFRMRINCDVIVSDMINNAVNRYNEERNIAKRKQLKLEGF